MKPSKRRAAACLLGLLPVAATAKPIAYANGTTVMAEYGAGTMNEVQVFHAPRYWWSAGGGWLERVSEDRSKQRHISYVRGNLLARRWNLPAAQANVFVWGGLGRATGNDFRGSVLARNAGFQIDFETRRVYTSLRSDLQESERFSHRVDTLQLGWAPTPMTTTPWPRGSSCRLVATRVVCTREPKPRCSSVCSRAAPGWISAPPPAASCRPWPCSTSDLGDTK
jgi:hypothetical protein